MKRSQGVIRCLWVLGAGLILLAVWNMQALAEEVFPCKPEVKMDADTAAKAKLDQFVCFLKEWEGVETLHFKVAIKNVSAQPQRYRVNIFLQSGKAVGGLIPRKTKKGLVQPGQTAAFVYPVKNMPQKPEEIMVKLSTMAP